MVDTTGRRRRLGRRLGILIGVILVGSGVFLGLAFVNSPGDTFDQSATARMEQLSRDPAAAAAYLDPGSNNSRQVLSALLERGPDAAAILTTAQPPINPFPSDASIGDVIRAATADPANEADRRIAVQTLTIFAAKLGYTGSIPGGMQNQLSAMTTVYLRHCDFNNAMDGSVKFPVEALYTVTRAAANNSENVPLLLQAEEDCVARQFSAVRPAAEASESDAHDLFSLRIQGMATDAGFICGRIGLAGYNAALHAGASQSAEASRLATVASAALAVVQDALAANPVVDEGIKSVAISSFKTAFQTGSSASA